MANTREHRYAVALTWTGNLGTGTSGYRDYSRDYEIAGDGKRANRRSMSAASQCRRYSATVILVGST